MLLKPGTRVRSVVCTTELVVVRAPTAAVDLECGGAPMIPAKDERPAGHALDPDLAAGTVMGKRYADEAVGLELLCTKAGEGSLTIGGVALQLKDAKPLPASD